MRTLKNVILLAAACMLVLPACDDPKEEPKIVAEICNNTTDDDGDGKADCEDSDCAADAACKAKTENCANGVDDDGDGKADCDDTDCANAANCQSSCNAGEIECGSTCCTAGQVCNNGVCETQQQCGTGETACGSTCCTAGQTCNNGVCETQQQCGTGETACGTDCCTADETCNNGVCEAQQGCATGETECGEDCCGANETCQDGACIGTVPAGCTVASYGTVAVTGDVQTDTGVMALSAQLPATDGTTDFINLELYEGYGALAGGIAPGTYTIAGDDLNYATCGLCVRLMGDIDMTAGTIGAHYFITGGTVVITSVDGALEATLTGAEFVEVTIDSQTYATTPVPDGCTASMDTVDFQGTVPVTCDPLAPTCATGEGCYYDSNAQAFFCMPAGTVLAGEACTALGECVPGAECMDPGICREWCDPASATACTGAEVCTEVGTGLGICEVVEDCATTGDEDGNGLADCDDPACSGEPTCIAPLCQAATPVTGATAQGDNTNGTQAFQGSCKGAGKEQIFTVTAGTTGQLGQLTITVTTPFDAVVYARTNCEDGTTELGCVDDALSNAAEALVIDDYQGGTPITLFVDAYGTSATAVGAFDIAVEYVVPVCGDGAVELSETCDDTNTTAGDGCSDTCQVETGYACPTAGAACRQISCGDGFVDAPEACDDTNATAGDGCSDTCTVETGYVCPTEGQACRQIVCGDGFQDAGEACDDGNTTAGDGCSDTCQVELTEVESNNDMGSANAYSDPFNAEMTAGDVDWVSIVLTDTSSITVEVLDDGSGACATNDLDSKLEVLDANGTVLGSDDDSGAGYCSLVTIPRAAAGTYYIKVLPYDSSTTFFYRLSVTIGAPEACGIDASLGSPVPVTSAAETGAMQGGGIYVAGRFDLNADPDYVSLELYEGFGAMTAGVVPGTYTLSGDDLNYGTCGLCVRIVDQNRNSYMATAATVEITSVSGNLTGTLTNATFEQVTIASDFTSTPVPGGCQSSLTSMAFDAVIQ